MAYTSPFVFGYQIPTPWFQEVDILVNGVLDGAQTTAAVLAALGLTAAGEITLPVPLALGGTGQTTAAAALAALGGVGLSTVNQTYIGTTLWPPSPAEIAAAVTIVNPYYYYGDVRRYGAVLDGATDGTTALAAACKVGGLVTISGALALASASLAALLNTAVTLISGTTVQCLSDGSIVVTGGTGCNIFYSLNATNITLQNVVATGNGNAATATTGYFWYCQALSTAAADMSSLKVLGGTLTNFAGYYWIYFDNFLGTTYRMKNIQIKDVLFVSQAGNCQGPTSQVITATCVGFSGSDAVNYFGIEFVQVSGCVAYGQFIKTLVDVWSGVQQVKVFGNLCYSFSSDASFSNDVGAYVLLVYDHSHGAAAQPDMIEFYDNQINGCRDAGIYVAGAQRIWIRGNDITAQTSTADGTIPKGGIALNGPIFAMLDNNSMDGCAISLSVVLNAGNSVSVNNLTVTEITAGNVGVKVNVSGSGAVGEVIFDGAKIETSAATTTGFQLNSNSTAGVAIFALRNFRIATPYNGFLQVSSDSSVPALGSVHISNGEIANCALNAFGLANCSNAATRSVIEGLQFISPAPGCVVFNIESSTNLVVRNITFQDMTTGATFCWYGGSAQGSVEGVRYRNVAAANRFSGATAELGSTSPIGVFAGNDTDFIQNLNPTEAGSTSSKYILMGWQWDSINAAWKACSSLTGN